MVSWVPLECDSEAFSKFLNALGINQLSFNDVYSLDDEMISFIPQPVKAFLLLFPITQKYEEFSKQQHDELVKAGKVPSGDIYFMKQTIQNACGTIAILHAMLNNMGDFNSPILNEFYNKTKALSPLERGSFLENNEAIASIHHQQSQEGQTAAPDSESDVDLHFICFIERNGHLFELDGRKEFPIDHGPIKESFTKTMVVTVKKFMELEPDQVNFNVMALSAAE